MTPGYGCTQYTWAHPHLYTRHGPIHGIRYSTPYITRYMYYM